MGEIFTTPAKKPSPRWPGHLEGERRLCWGEELVPGAPLVPFGATRRGPCPAPLCPSVGLCWSLVSWRATGGPQCHHALLAGHAAGWGWG